MGAQVEAHHAVQVHSETYGVPLSRSHSAVPTRRELAREEGLRGQQVGKTPTQEKWDSKDA